MTWQHLFNQTVVGTDDIPYVMGKYLTNQS